MNASKLVEYVFGETPIRKRKAVLTEDIVRLHRNMESALGVSATHLDWTMVPYVRKSFRKHFIDGSKYVARIDGGLENWLEANKELPFDYEGLKDNYPKTYEYAMDMTKKELEQSVEGLFHNLNTLQSRSGNQLKWMAG